MFNIYFSVGSITAIIVCLDVNIVIYCEFREAGRYNNFQTFFRQTLI